MQKIVPFLWFESQAEEAMNYYISIFKNAKVLSVSRYGKGTPMPEGMVMTAAFELNGQQFVALNGGPQFKFTEAVSFVINCENQQEIDEFWDKLSKGGEKQMCGWLKDKYGLSWQVVPKNMAELLQPKDPQKAMRAMQAMMQMDKIVIDKLQNA